ncbi:thioredoxin family protein [Cruoricaptor ignavus]|uniref:Thioredoxin family protein n=1 Tax=Cruoricaptor ignavus TaxID=1118202 RepID=A0A7M1T3J0_9FLAO|nr:thioredoxin family protein [Cruoricaptor ignavus]QOR73857.1 thioredoxin family protein [Cruoricaptor ignavus]
MKNYILLLFAFFLQIAYSCESKKVVINREVESKKDGPMLLGRQSADQFQKEPYSGWFSEEFNEYQIDDAAVAELKKQKISSYQITAFVGTWCEDTHRELPRLLKILGAANYPKEKLNIIAVNRKMESPSGEEGLYNIKKVPTIIVKKYGRELGRITETPKSGYLERDLAEILRTDDGNSVGNIFKK